MFPPPEQHTGKHILNFTLHLHFAIYLKLKVKSSEKVVYMLNIQNGGETDTKIKGVCWIAETTDSRAWILN